MQPIYINLCGKEEITMEATLECVTLEEEAVEYACHTDCGPFWSDDDD